MRIPAMVNAHSHAFQIELRGVGERTLPDDDFWAWRTEMYRLAGKHDPDTMNAVGQRCYSEMLHAGYGAVGEFHYVHHQPDGRPYAERNAMAIALAEAALSVGLEIVLLPAAYHRAGPGLPPFQGQLRFCDPDVETFLERVDELRAWASARERVGVGVAVHSVRAVPASWIEAIAAYAERHDLVRHVHACEQRRELAECHEEHGCSPIELLERCGFLGPRTSVVHAIHVTDVDIELIATSGTTVVACPTTEGNLGDGYQPAVAYRDAGVPYAIGSDSQVRLDPFEEVRELETGARRERETRHALLALDDSRLWERLVRGGRVSLGLTGSPAEIEIDEARPELAGIAPADIPYALAT
ncbi:MAG TPA: formimidoylglutamate deiminase, partial [Solirubrobacteraceae bacterium]